MEPIYEHGICYRGVVSVTELLMAYYEICMKKAFNCGGIADHPATCNLPLIVGFDARYRVDTLDRRIHDRVYSDDFSALNYIRNLRPSGGTADEIHNSLMRTMTELIKWLHVANTRNPREVNVGEVVEYRVLLEQLQLLMPMIEDEQELCDYIDAFLLSSFLAGVEGGVPVVPTCVEFYENVYLRGFDVDPGTLFETNEEHRGEARWVNDTSPISPMLQAERAHRRRKELRVLQKMADKINRGKPLSRKYMDQLEGITNGRSPFIPVVREQSEEDEELQRAMEELAVEPPSMQAMGQFHGMNYEEVRDRMARDRGHAPRE
jgi:hypothetical protein